jgi:ribosomal protein S18 acetylase RimI-like enzyme
MSFETIYIQTSKETGVANIVINRPKLLNILNQLTLKELGDAFEICGSEEDVRAIILTAEGGKALWLEDWIVHPAHRGCGIGGRLLRHAIGQARRRGFRRISLLTDRDNLSAQKQYAKQGFKLSAMVPMRLSL